MKRSIEADYAKAIGIFFVLLGHTQIWGPVVDWVSVFHMPLFFFISGFLFSYDRNPQLGPFLKKRFRQLVIPYIFINLITFFFWFFISRHYGSSVAEETVVWYAPLQAALSGNGSDMLHNIPLWFFLCLFIIEIVYYVLYRPLTYGQRLAVSMLFALLGYINYEYIPFILPFSLGTAFVAIPFYFLGNACSVIFQERQLTNFGKSVIFIISIAVVTYFSTHNERVFLYCNHYGNYLFFIVAALCGISMMYVFIFYLSKWIGKNKVITYISRNTLTICGFHLMIYTLIKGVSVYILGLPLQIYEGTILPNVLLAVAGMAICCGMAYLLNRYCPVIIGK